MDDEKLRIEDEYSRERRAISDEITEYANRLAEAQAEADLLAVRKKALDDQIQSMRKKERQLSQKLNRARAQRDKRLAQVGKEKKKKQQQQKRKEQEEEEDLDYSEASEEDESPPLPISSSSGTDPLLSGIRLESKRADRLTWFAMDQMILAPLNQPGNQGKLLLWKPPGLVDGYSQSWESFLEEVRYDQYSRVRSRAKTVLSGSWVEEEAALADPTNNSRYKLRGYRALDTALRSPDCSFRTLGLLVGWAYATDAGSQCYQLDEMLGAWVAGFEGLEWPGQNGILPLSFLPQRRNTGRKIVLKPMNSATNICIRVMDPPISGVHGWPFTKLPLRWRSDEHEYISALPKTDDGDDDLLDLDAIYVAPNLNTQRLVNQASKFLNLLYTLPLSTIVEAFLTPESKVRPYRLEEVRKHVSKRSWVASAATWGLVERVVKTILELE